MSRPLLSEEKVLGPARSDLHINDIALVLKVLDRMGLLFLLFLIALFLLLVLLLLLHGQTRLHAMMPIFDKVLLRKRHRFKIVLDIALFVKF